MILVTATVWAITCVLAVLTQDAETPATTALLSLAFALPAAILARRGHFGLDHWEYPTVGGMVFIAWQMGLAPSMSALDPEARWLYRFSDESVAVGRVVFFVWFMLFALACGRVAERRPTMQFSLSLPAACILGALWLACGAIAFRSGRFSNYSAQAASLETGGAAMAAVLLYSTLTPLLPSVGLVLLSSPRRAGRVFAWLFLLLSGGALFLAAARSSFVLATGCACLVLRARGARPRPGPLLVAAAIATLLFGPILLAYRASLRDGGSADPLSLAAESTRRLSADREARSSAMAAASTNVSARLGYSSQFFVALEHTLTAGPNLAGTMFRGFIRNIPSFIWPEKNVVADALDLENQLARTGRFPDVDLGPSPILEFVFELGPFFGALGGILYGLLAKFVDQKLVPATARLSSWVLFAATASAMLAFEGSVAFLVLAVREPAFVALTLAVAERAWSRPKTPRAAPILRPSRAASSTGRDLSGPPFAPR